MHDRLAVEHEPVLRLLGLLLSVDESMHPDACNATTARTRDASSSTWCRATLSRP
jgi:hypothetical protein